MLREAQPRYFTFFIRQIPHARLGRENWVSRLPENAIYTGRDVMRMRLLSESLHWSLVDEYINFSNLQERVRFSYKNHIFDHKFNSIFEET